MKDIVLRNKEMLILAMVALLTVFIVFFHDYSSKFSNSPNYHSFDGALPVLGSYENLKNLLDERYSSPLSYSGPFKMLEMFTQRSTGNDLLMGAMDEAANAIGFEVEESLMDSGAAASGDFSGTNVQVQGVDEADIIKTDGKYIYHVNNQRVVVATAYPPEDMDIAGMLSFDGKEFSPREMYLDDKHLVVFGSGYQEIPNYNYNEPRDMPEAEIMIYPPPFYRQGIVKVKIFDISDKSNIKELREIDIEGYYVSSRKIDSSLYFVVNKHLDYYYIMQGDDIGHQNTTPSYRDTAIDDDFVNIDYDEIRYFPDFSEPNYMIIGGIDLDKIDQKIELQTFLGSGENVYSSRENLYVAITGYEYENSGIYRSSSISNTSIYKFALNKGAVSFKSKGEVPGRILNQFSMDEHKNHFRIATTTGEMWRTDEGTSKNNIYILDEELEITGKVEDIAPGERIYSVRYMGDKGYMVTFRTVDPLFVIDLKDPKNPKILGELKIPGYSDYLHPYDENHLIGFGKEAVEVPQKDHLGNVIDMMALEQGMKVALFDVSDVSNPVEKFNETIGDRGTDSPLLWNHKALLFNRERNLLAFPVTVMEERQVNGGEWEDFFEYGEFVFQGAYVYGIDIEEGFNLRGKITHLAGEDYKKAGHYWYDSDKNVERIIHIGDVLYTLSNSEIRATDMDTLKKINSLMIK